MKHTYCASYKNIRLRPLEEKDIEALRVWRNDRSQTQFLRRLPEITPAMQQTWYRNYLEDPDEMIFAIEETEQLSRMVGSVALYDFHGSVAEEGKIQIGDPEAHGRGIGRDSIALALVIGFQKLGLQKIKSSVHRENIASYKSHRAVGFQVTGHHPAPVGGIEDEMEITEEMFCRANSCMKDAVLG